MKLHPHFFTGALLCIIFILLPSNLNSQASKDYKLAQLVIKQYFKNNVPKSYVLVSIENKEYLIIEKNKLLSSKSKIDNDNTVLNRAFNRHIYHKNYINWDSDYAIFRNAFSAGKPMYFYYQSEDGTLYGETNLSTIVHPNPIDVSVFGYVLNELSNNIN
ncbi:hypothetical protein ACOSP6_05875 [Tenacibaculum sp. MEBiC06402]|uniref:hypothetical protein n=1 Tax=unclassified Tenacibaculum TaxID=2635139 RepID=UPI003B99918F